MSNEFRPSGRGTKPLLVALVSCALLLMSCGGGDDDATAEPPQITGCNSVSYEGINNSWGFGTGCDGTGVASFQSTITQQGQTICLRITCAGGCIETASSCSSESLIPTVP